MEYYNIKEQYCKKLFKIYRNGEDIYILQKQDNHPMRGGVTLC